MIFNCHCTHPHPIVWGGVGWGGMITSLAFPHDLDATLHDLHWHFHMILMLRSMIFIGNSTWSWCYAPWASLAFPHDLDATLHDLHWQFHMILMLRSMIFNCHCTHPHPIVWGGVGWGGMITSLAFPHDLDATLYDLHWHFHMILMLRSMIFIGISTWSWCYAPWSSLAIPHDFDATLYDLHWQFHMILMLRSMIFIGISTWSWCYAPWSSLAIPHDLNATLYDLQLPLHTSASDSLGWGGVGWGGVGWGGMITSFPRLGSILA